MHRAIHQWDRWLKETLGVCLIEAERQFLPKLLTDCYGKHALLIGVPNQYSLLKFSAISHQVLVSPLINRNKNISYIEGEFYELPIASGSIDLVLLPHTLEYIDNPRQVLSESCRVVKPEGYIIVAGFNPYSLWGLKKNLLQQQEAPWTNNFIAAGLVKKWLKLADFELIKSENLFFRPPLQEHAVWFNKLKTLEWLGSKFWSPLGGVYMLVAKAKIIPLTPIRLHWQQELSGERITIPGPSTRNSY